MAVGWAMTPFEAELAALLDCPFCGQSAEYYDAIKGLVRCTNSQCFMHTWVWDVEQWNKRAPCVDFKAGMLRAAYMLCTMLDDPAKSRLLELAATNIRAEAEKLP